MRVADDPSHSGNSRDFLGRTLRVAAGDHDTGVRLRSMDAANGLAKLVIGGGGDGTSVQDDEVGVSNFAGGVEAARGESGFERSSIGL